ncbi:MAG: glycosyltransferase family protein, partial [Thermoplasmatales archaeon]|nr:glycosyltransferase family protein [Thermoplasmatales archaeon]
PMLWHIINRVKRVKLIDKIVVATTINEEDKEIIELAIAEQIEGFAGSEEDVLDRYYQVAKKCKVDIIVRITSDNPLIDPEIIDKIIKFYLDNEDDLDYVSNTIDPTYPEGLDVEVFSFDALEKAWKEANKKSEREHVTPYIWDHPNKFKIASIKKEGENLSHLRWTVDYENDLKFVREVYRNLYNKDNFFLMQDVLYLIKKFPYLNKINEGIVRYEGYIKSLEKDN